MFPQNTTILFWKIEYWQKQHNPLKGLLPSKIILFSPTTIVWSTFLIVKRFKTPASESISAVWECWKINNKKAYFQQRHSTSRENPLTLLSLVFKWSIYLMQSSSNENGLLWWKNAVPLLGYWDAIFHKPQIPFSSIVFNGFLRPFCKCNQNGTLSQGGLLFQQNKSRESRSALKMCF